MIQEACDYLVGHFYLATPTKQQATSNKQRELQTINPHSIT